MPHGADQAAVLQLHLAELRERGLHAELLHVGRVHGADQRLDQPLEDLASQAPADKRRHALVPSVAPRRDEVLQARPKLPQRAEDRRQRQRPHPRGGHHQEPVRQLVQPTGPDHVGLPVVWVGADQLLAQSQPLAEGHAPGHGGDEIVGALFHLVAVLVDRPQHASQSRAALEEHQPTGGLQLDQPVRG